MNNNKKKIVISFLFGLLLSTTQFSYAGSSYTFTDLGLTGSYAADINDSGQVAVGITTTPTGYLYSNGTVQDIGDLGAQTTYVNGINNRGQVVGWSSSGINLPDHPFVYSNGSMQDLGLVGNDSRGYGINNNGQVVGIYLRSDSNNNSSIRGYLYDNGNVQDLGSLGGSSTFAFKINDNGQVVGYSAVYDSTGGYGWQHAYVYSNGAMYDIGTLGGVNNNAYYNSVAYSINNNGQVVGVSGGSEQGYDHAFSYGNGTMQDLGTLGGSSSYAFDVNDSGQVVGGSRTKNGGFDHAFLYANGKMNDLNDYLDDSAINAGWLLTSATAINNSGAIVGDAYNYQTRLHTSYLLTALPVPEPDTYAMMLSGAGILVLIARREKEFKAIKANS